MTLDITKVGIADSKTVIFNKLSFSPKTSKVRGLFLKENKNTGFVEANTEWYRQIQ